MSRARRGVRIGVVAAVGYVAAAVGFQLLMLVSALVARVAVGDPTTDELDGVGNLRMADDQVWFGAQPEPEAYAELVRRGVTSVIDLRTGAADDERVADAVIEDAGLTRHWIPVPDGHAPRPADVRRFLAIVDRAPGIVFVHCGGGVGRTNTMQAAYVAASGREPSVADLMAVGPMTVEQLWVVADAEAGRPGARNVVVRRVSEVLDAPRRAFSRVRALG